MDAKKNNEAAPVKNNTTVERKSDRELAVRRTFNGPARIVFEAWTKPELFRRWWTPKSFGLTIHSCEMDVRVGGTYRLMISHPASEQPMAFFGKYIEVAPHARLAWTNDESADGAITTVTFEEEAARRWSSCTTSIPRRKLSTRPSLPGAPAGQTRRSRNLRSFLSPWARAWEGHDVVG